MAFIQTSDQSGAGIAAAAGLARGGVGRCEGVARGGGWVEGSLIRTHLPLIKEGVGGRVAITTRVQGVWTPPYQDNSWPPSQALISLENKSRHVRM